MLVRVLLRTRVTNPNRTRKESDGWTRVTPECSESWVGWPMSRLPYATNRCNFEAFQNVTDGFLLFADTLHQKSSKTASGFYLGPLNKIEMQYCVVYGVRSRWIATIPLSLSTLNSSRAHQFEELTWGDDWSWWQPGEMIPKSLCVNYLTIFHPKSDWIYEMYLVLIKHGLL